MAIHRLPEATQALYSELLDQIVAAEAARAPFVPRQGSFVSKLVKGNRYWYWQRVEAGRKRQHYLGPESRQLSSWIRGIEEQREREAPDEARRAQLVEMLVAGGAARESAAVIRVLQVLADAGIFRLGGVVVGTQAFTCYANLLGVRFAEATSRTQDIDLAQERALGIALATDPPQVDMLAALQRAEKAFFPVPELDRSHPSTSFKVRGRDLRVDLLTPARGPNTGQPVWIPWLRAAAAPLPFLGYLIEERVQAVLVGGSGVLFDVPRPGRYALHKLWLTEQRSVAEQVKARKDVRQAAQLLEVLLADRPQEIRESWEALARRTRERRVVLRSLASHPEVEAFAATRALLGLDRTRR